MKVVKVCQPLTIFAKSSILDVLQGSEYSPGGLKFVEMKKNLIIYFLCNVLLVAFYIINFISSLLFTTKSCIASISVTDTRNIHFSYEWVAS